MTPTQRERALLAALKDIAKRALRIRDNKAVVGIEASYIERIALKAMADIESAQALDSDVTQGYSLVRNDILAWLHGEASLDGKWFDRPEGKGQYWWRSILRKGTLPSPASDADGDK